MIYHVLTLDQDLSDGAFRLYVSSIKTSWKKTSSLIALGHHNIVELPFGYVPHICRFFGGIGIDPLHMGLFSTML